MLDDNNLRMKVLKTIKSILGVTNTKAIPTDKNKAYSIYAYGRIEAPSIEELLDDEYKRILSDIETRASYGYTCLVYQYPAWMNKDNKTWFSDNIKSLNFTVLFNDDNYLLISWL